MRGQGLRIAILTTRDRRYHPNRRLLESASRMGHQAVLLHPRSVLAGVRMEGRGKDWPQVVVPRIGSTIEDHELAVLFHLEREGIPCLNGFRALVVARDKFLSLKELERGGIPVPRGFLILEPGQMARAVKALGGFPVVVKGLRGRQGTTVERVQDLGFARYLAAHPPHPVSGVLLQEFLTKAPEGDTRILVVRDQAVACMRRVPKGGEFRSNVHLRGRGAPWQPPRQWIELAVEATRVLGLEVAGVDMLEGPQGPLVLEVNTTPGFRELERVTAVDVASRILEAAVELSKEG
jgi:ribosomal protein S6--L-glutamate ligase